MSNHTQWTLDKIIRKVQDDLELHAEIFTTPDDLQQFCYDAIDDAEETIIDCFSDFFLAFTDYNVTAGEGFLAIPDDIYELRIRGLYYDKNSFNQASGTSLSNWYKIKKITLETMANVDQNDLYQYRIVNNASGPVISMYPNIRNESEGRFRLWYIRQAIRPENGTDIIERGLRPQFLIAHMKVSVLVKENSDFLMVAKEELDKQKAKLINSLSRLSDDEEDSYLKPDINSLYEAYGDGVDGLIGFGG